VELPGIQVPAQPGRQAIPDLTPDGRAPRPARPSRPSRAGRGAQPGVRTPGDAGRGRGRLSHLGLAAGAHMDRVDRQIAAWSRQGAGFQNVGNVATFRFAIETILTAGQ